MILFIVISTGHLARFAHALCINTPYGRFVDSLSRLVVVEESQIDFSVSHKGLCDSIEGPFCHSLFNSPSIHSEFELTGELLQRTLGIPKEITLTLTGEERNSGTSSAHLFYVSSKIRLNDDGTPANFLFLNSFQGSTDDASITFRGDWYRDSHETILAFSRSAEIASIKFHDPVVLQEIDIVPIAGSNAPMMVVGRLGGKEQWRRQIGVTNSLIGHQVFARWKANGSVHRATVMFDEGPSGGVFVSWKDGDQSFRSLSRSEIVTIVQGHPQHIRAVDEVLLLSPRREAVYVLRDLIVSRGPEANKNIHVVRSGGGLVFEEDISPAALIYTANEMIKRSLRIKDSDKTGSTKLGLLLADGLQPHAMLHTVYHSRKTLRNFILFTLLSEESDFIVHLSKNLIPETISKFLNINDMVSAYIDSAGERGDQSLMLQDFRFMTQLAARSKALSGAILIVGDTFGAQVVCSNETTSKAAEILITDSQYISDALSKLKVRVRVGSDEYMSDAEMHSNFSFLHVPGKFPMSLVILSDGKSKLELVGSFDVIGCGGLVFSPTDVSPSSRGFALSSQKAIAIEATKSMISTFNAGLLGIKTSIPYSSAGAYAVFI